MSKQTSVEWLLEKISNYDSKIIELFEKEIDQAKEMEKQNIINFTNDFITLHTYGDWDGIVQKNKTTEQYYNETFNK